MNSYKNLETLLEDDWFPYSQGGRNSYRITDFFSTNLNKSLDKKGRQMYRAHKIRLNPTPEQEQYLRQACGVARHAFNWGLAEWMLDPSGQSWLKQ